MMNETIHNKTIYFVAILIGIACVKTFYQEKNGSISSMELKGLRLVNTCKKKEFSRGAHKDD